MDIRLVDADDARTALEPQAVKEALRRAFAGLRTARSVQPAQTLIEFPGGGGDCIFYPSSSLDLDLVGVKVSPYISALSSQGKSPVSAYTLLVSASTGEPVLLCDSLALTTARTAATTALALDYLAGADAARLAVIGSGPIALEHLRYVAPQRAWSSLRLWSRGLAGDTGRDLADQRQRQVDALGIDAQVVTELATALDGADVVMLCTSSATPVLDLAALAPTATITSISTSGPRAHEIDPAELPGLSVYCDYRVTAPVTAGEMVIAQESGWSAASIVADLPELVTAETPHDLPPGRRFFRSTGLGIEDLAIASLLR